MNYKHLIEAWRSKKATFVQLLPPLLLVALSLGGLPTPFILHHPITDIDLTLPPSCASDANCRRILFYPCNDTFYDQMQRFSEDTHMSIAPRGQRLQDDIAGSAQYDINCFDKLKYSYYDSSLDLGFLDNVQIHTNAIVRMLTDQQISVNTRCHGNCHAYTTYTNSTPLDWFSDSQGRKWVDGMHLAMQKAIYRGATGQTADLTFTHKDYPDTPDRNPFFSASQWEPLIIVFAISFGMLFIFVNIVAEAETGMRGYLKSMGLPDWVYWSSWFFHHFTLYTIVASVLLLFGYTLPHIQIFRRTEPGIMVFLFFSYGVSLVFWASAWAALFRKARTAFILSFFLFLITIGLGICGGLPSIFMIEMENPSVLGGALHPLFYMVPPWHLVRLLINIEFVTTPQDGMNSTIVFNRTSLFTNTTEFTWTTGHYPSYVSHSKPSRDPVEYLYGLWVNALVYLILLVYLDKVWPDPNKCTLEPWFLVNPAYWTGKGTVKSSPYAPVYTSQNDPDVIAERNRAMGNEDIALKAKGLFKVFGSKSVLSDFYLSAEAGTIVALLGHNGAGKTTLINILTGKTSPSDGDATIFNVGIRDDMSEIQSSIGICPQFDVLWPDLTASEHAKVIGMIKREETEDAEELLKSVDLHNVEQLTASQYSGGMKRRLQVALSIMGNPRMIILDEPTTGMDPVNRRRVWTLIRSIKSNKLIFLTTHAMEEAEVLGEKIAIMKEGHLCTVGSSLHMKNKHATGYRLQIIPMDGEEEKVISTMSTFPMANLAQRSGGNLVYSVQKAGEDKIGQMLEQIQILAGVNGGTKVIRDWGLSNSTLEDVFMTVTQ